MSLVLRSLCPKEEAWPRALRSTVMARGRSLSNASGKGRLKKRMYSVGGSPSGLCEVPTAGCRCARAPPSVLSSAPVPVGWGLGRAFPAEGKQDGSAWSSRSRTWSGRETLCPNRFARRLGVGAHGSHLGQVPTPRQPWGSGGWTGVGCWPGLERGQPGIQGGFLQPARTT